MPEKDPKVVRGWELAANELRARLLSSPIDLHVDGWHFKASCTTLACPQVQLLGELWKPLLALISM